MTPTQELHAELVALREEGVTLDGICKNVNDDDSVLEEILDEKFYYTNSVFPLSVRTNVSNIMQYCVVRGDKDEEYLDDSFVHDYLCERWALLNDLINETGDL
jgi:hypothetical protein